MKKDIKIYEHNKNAFNSVLTKLETSNRTCVVHPTGTGKMYVGLQLIDAMEKDRILYVASLTTILHSLKKELKSCGIYHQCLDISTYRGISKRLYNQYDYIILDEFHRTGATLTNKNINKLLQNNPNAKVLGLSATSIRHLDNMRDMTEEFFDGNIASWISLEDAITDGILDPPKYVTTISENSNIIKNYQTMIDSIENDTERKEAQRLLDESIVDIKKKNNLSDIFERNMEIKDGRYIIFCPRNSLESIEKQCQNWFRKVNTDIEIYKVHSKASDKANNKAIDDFENSTSGALKLMLSIDMLNEGTHIKNINGIIMMRPTESANIYLQQLGRIFAVNTKNTVVIDIVGNALTLQDNMIRKTDKKHSKHSKRKRDFDIRNILKSFEIEEQLQDFLEVSKKIDHLVIHTEWDIFFECAKAYYEKYGNLYMPYSYLTPNGKSVRIWLENEIAMFEDNKLSLYKIEKLESIGVVWRYDELQWNVICKHIETYYNEHENLNVPKSYIMNNGDNLGRAMIYLFEDFANDRLPDYRVAFLKDYGVEFPE